MVNKVILIGNLGKDPEVRRIENGSTVAKFSVATTENWKDKNGEWQSETEWHNVVVWRHLAENAEANLKKGSQVYVEGKLTTRKWEDNDGKTRYSTEVSGRMFRILGRRQDDEGQSNVPQSNEPSKEPQPAGTDDDLPF